MNSFWKKSVFFFLLGGGREVVGTNSKHIQAIAYQLLGIWVVGFELPRISKSQNLKFSTTEFIGLVAGGIFMKLYTIMHDNISFSFI